MKKENILPVNAFYLTWLRDKGCKNREEVPAVIDKDTGEITKTKNRMDSIDMLIYIMLLSRADKKSFKCYPSIATICNDCCSIARRTVWEHLQQLEGMGYIDIEKQPGKANVYFMRDFVEWRKHPCY